MVTVVPPEKPGFLADVLGVGLNQVVSDFQQQKKAQQQQEQNTKELDNLADFMGLSEEQKESFRGLSPDIAKVVAAEKIKQGPKQEQQEKLFSMLFGETGGENIPTTSANVGRSLGETSPASGEGSPSFPNVQEMDDKQIAAISMMDPNVGKMLQSQKDAGEKRLERKAALHAPATKKYFEGLSDRADALPQKQAALQSMTSAIEGGDLGTFSPDYLAEITGIDAFRTPTGAAFVSSGKEYFLGSLKRAGARPNQWIEQQIQKMLPQIGRSKEANLTVAETLKTENLIEEKQVELGYQLANELEETLGYVPRDLPQRVAKQMKPFAEEQQKILEEKLRQISSEVVLKKVPKGTPLNKEMALQLFKKAKGDKTKAAKIARGLGYDF